MLDLDQPAQLERVATMARSSGKSRAATHKSRIDYLRSLGRPVSVGDMGQFGLGPSAAHAWMRNATLKGDLVRVALGRYRVAK